MSHTDIEKYIDEYINTHPSFVPPETSQHPCVLALTTEMYPEIVKKAGGVDEFWRRMFIAAKAWFAPGEDSFEYNYFSGRLFGACGLSTGTDFEMQMNEIWKSFVAWERNGIN